MVEDLLRGFILKNRPELDELDFEHMTRVPDDWVPDGPRCADMMWSIPFYTLRGGDARHPSAADPQMRVHRGAGYGTSP